MASIGLTFPERIAGIHAEINIVKADSKTDVKIEIQEILNPIPRLLSPTSCTNPFPINLRVIPMPIIPDNIPRGIPIRPTIAASVRIIL